MAEHTIVYPRPGVTVYLAGGTHGFKSGPVPMRTDHAAALSAHVMTEAEKAEAEKLAPGGDQGNAAEEKPAPAA